MKPRIAVVVPDLANGGGIPATGAYLYRTINESGRYQADLVSLATASRDAASVRLLSPGSWLNGPRVVDGTWGDRPFRHAGAVLSELEFQRYRPRRVLTALLNGYDLVQVVGGCPAWAMTARDVIPPVTLHVASLAAVERRSMLSRQTGPIRLWREAMTVVTSRFDSTALGHVDTVFAMNPWLFEHIRAKLPDDRVVFAPPGIDTDRFRPLHAADHRGDDFILCVGRLSDPRKNVRLLFSAYHLLCQATSAAPRLVLAGRSGPSPGDWAEAERLGIADRVEIREDVSPADLAELYRRASLFVLASDEEGFGFAVVEAMASGVPVVSTRSGGPDMIIDDGTTGCLVPLNDTPALAAAMRQILESPGIRQAMGEAARRVAVERYSLQATGQIFIRGYDALLAGRSDRSR